jgi:hypothetical protein
MTMLVVAYRKRGWAFLYSWRSLLLHGLALIFPRLWYRSVPAGDFQSEGMLIDITEKLAMKGGWHYLKQVLIFPLQTLEQLLPIAGVLIFAYYRRLDLGKWREQPDIVTAFIIALLNYLPYWLSPQSGIRYVLPLFPFAGLILAYLSFYGSPKVREWSVKWIIVAIVLKFVLGLWGFPFYHKRFRGSAEAAQDIVHITGGYPLYVTNNAASGITTVAHIDRLIYPKAPLVWPAAQFTDGFVISYTPDPDMGMLYKKYRIGGDDLYLLCRGAACARR